MASLTVAPTASLTSTMASAAATSLRAAPQGGVIEGLNPVIPNSKDPFTLFVIQAGIIIILCRILHFPLAYLRQPRVIAEVLGGIVLGPSILGRINGFTDAIFPTAAMPMLSLVANIGLVLFLFLVGLEVDLRFLSKHWKAALSVGALGMLLPFGFGVAIAWGLYTQFHDEPGLVPISFGVFALFVGVAMAITAFPVLCRILTELDLLSTPVGIIVLAAGVGNDVVGWILLALCVALVNAGTGLSALYVLLATVGFVLVLVYAVRPAFMWVLRRNRSLEDGPSQGIIALTLLMALTSAFFTGIIGVHAIFGAFVAGLICPHEGGFAIKVTEKLEDLVAAVFLPLFFALSGLNTNLSLLDSGITWAYVIGVITVAFVGKFVGGTIAARFTGMVWREAATIGSLMSCKGLVELIVLNIGLQANILSKRTFTIFVVMALVTTFATTPLTAALYPPWYQKKIEAWKRGEIDWDTGMAPSGSSNASIDSISVSKGKTRVQSMIIYLRLDNMPSLIAFVSLFAGKASEVTKVHPSQEKTLEDSLTLPEQASKPVEVHGVRLLELTDRGSSVMKVSEVDEYTAHDPVINTFRTIGRLNNLAVSGEVAIGVEESFPNMLTSRATDEDTDLLLLPWSATGGMHETALISNDNEKTKLQSSTFSLFAAKTLDTAAVNTAVFIDRGFGGSSKTRPTALTRTMSNLSFRSSNRDNRIVPASQRGHHVYAPFFGGHDGRLALRLALQLAENPYVTATLVFFENTSGVPEVMSPAAPEPAHTTTTTAGGPISPMGASSIMSPLSPATKELMTATIAAPPTQASRERDSLFFAALQRTLAPELAARVVFVTVPTADPVRGAVSRAAEEVGLSPRNGGDLVVVGRNKGWFGRDPSRYGTLGVAANAIVESGAKASLLVVQARRTTDA